MKKISVSTLVTASLLTTISIVLTRVLSVMLPIAGTSSLRIDFGSIPIIITGILFGPIVGGFSGLVADVVGLIINAQGIPFPGFTISSMLWGIIPGIIYMFIKSKNSRINFNIINTIFILIISTGVVKLLYNQNIITFKNSMLYFYNNRIPNIIIAIYVIVILVLIMTPIIVSMRIKESKSIYSIDKILFTVTVSYVVISMGLNTLWLSIMFKKGFMILFPIRVLASVINIPISSVIIFTLSKYFKYSNR
ncbi:putative membrane protein [Gottschalkia purinilytica]|uniref:Putative membrane protein n=1 Tax=Gottschalkia purinilytica TaxID=1503 RepID=A0A0L0WES5_GOTPU|nr:folate family ECF transporter S component [Gottschalkia purinilytica]KNF09954.1 putative membrane protein [Gottschalkia purinilytica]